MSIEYLRDKIKQLNIERDKMVLEKGLAAEENKDLRENFAYDYWVEKEMRATIEIGNYIKEIERLYKKDVKPKPAVKLKKSKSVPTPKISDLPRNRWL